MNRSKKFNWGTLLAFACVVVLGGSNPVAVRFSNLDLPPFWGASIRFGTAAVIFWGIALSQKIKLPRGRSLIGIMVYGILTIGLSFTLLYWALLFLPASTTMVLGALTPLFTFFFAWAHGQESFRWQGLIGSLVAFIGILIGIGNQIGGTLPLLPILAVVIGFAATSEGAVLYKSFPKTNPLIVNAIALSVGTGLLLLVSIFTGEVWSLPGETNTWIVFAYLVLGGSVALFYLMLFVLDRWTASATSYAFMLFPLATIVIAAWLAGEVITPRFLAGSAVVLAGVWLGAIASPKGEPADPG